MFRHWKQVLTALCACSLLLVGCNGQNEDTSKEEEKIEISENAVYLVPEDPTAYMKTAYDEVSASLKDADEEEEAQALAKLFVADFFTLSNKESDTDVGGLNYIPSGAYEDMEQYARFYFYNNYSMIVSQLGEEQLPCVKDVTVNDVQTSTITYDGQSYDGYLIEVDIAYEDTEASDLKTNATLSIAKMDDYDYDTLESINNGELTETPLPKTLMRVIALE